MEKKLVASEKAVPLPQTFVIQAPDSPDTSLPGEWLFCTQMALIIS